MQGVCHKGYTKPLDFFCTDSLQGSIDGVFIFEDLAIEDSKTIQPYDAIVVEQWTILEVSM